MLRSIAENETRSEVGVALFVYILFLLILAVKMHQIYKFYTFLDSGKSILLKKSIIEISIF